MQRVPLQGEMTVLPSTFVIHRDWRFPKFLILICRYRNEWRFASFFRLFSFLMFSCCLQKQKAVRPLHYLTPLHFRSSVGENHPPQTWPKSLAYLSYCDRCAKCTNFFAGRESSWYCSIQSLLCLYCWHYQHSIYPLHLHHWVYRVFISPLSVAFSPSVYFSVFISCESFLLVFYQLSV